MVTSTTACGASEDLGMKYPIIMVMECWVHRVNDIICLVFLRTDDDVE